MLQKEGMEPAAGEGCKEGCLPAAFSKGWKKSQDSEPKSQRIAQDPSEQETRTDCWYLTELTLGKRCGHPEIPAREHGRPWHPITDGGAGGCFPRAEASRTAAAQGEHVPGSAAESKMLRFRHGREKWGG